jgi:hypothetical protein
MNQVFRVDSTQNSLPSGSARTTRVGAPLADIGVARPGSKEPLHLGLLIIGA